MIDGRRRFVCIVMAAVVLLVAPSAAFSQASPYVPTLDASYADLAALVRVGFVRGTILGQRPYSRMTFARAAAQARRAIEGGDAPPEERFHEALLRLATRFAPEIELLCAEGTTPCPEVRPHTDLRGVALEGTLADSPDRIIVSRYEGYPDRIDADVNPLLQGNQGRYLADGSTLAAEGWGDATLGNRFALVAHPRVWLARPDGGGTDAGATLLEGYVRGLFGNFSVNVGRSPVIHGNAREYGPILSGNARGLDMVRFSMEQPGRLPWIFRYLGPASFAGLIADLGEARDNPGGVLVVWEGAILPHPNLELGFALTNQQGGEGSPAATWSDRFFDIFDLQQRRPFNFLPKDPEISDKMLGLDARLTLPGLGTEAWLEFATTDDHWTAFDAMGEVFKTEAAWSGGIQLSGLGPDGRVDVWTEVGHNGIRNYTHHQFTSGYALDRRVLGSTLGPLATGWQAGLDWTGPRDRVSLVGAWERYSGDEWDRREMRAIRWIRLVDNPDETRLRSTLAWMREPPATGLRTTLRLGYERVTRFDFTDQNRANWMAQVRFDYLW